MDSKFVDVLFGFRCSDFRSSDLLPFFKFNSVVVWIHGGNFVRGSAAEYEPDYILDEDNIVLVTIQYRLGMFGFLSTEDPNAPGNYGMLDQVRMV